MIPGFPFDEVDLATNRNGHLTDRQLNRVRGEYQRRLRLLGLLLGLGPPVVLIGLVIGIRSGWLDEIEFRTLVGMVYGITLILIVPLLAFGMWSNYVKPIRNRTPASFTGPIRLRPRGQDIHLQFRPRWSGPRFAISPDQAEALIDGDRYTVYYTPGGSRSLFHSMEHVFVPSSRDDDEPEPSALDDEAETRTGPETDTADGPEDGTNNG